jgi:hypothetical protein
MTIGLDLYSKKYVLPHSAARHVIAAEGLVAVGRMIAVYRRGYGATTDYEIAWMTVALRELRVKDAAGSEGKGRCPTLGPDGSRAPGRAPAAVDRRGQAGAAWARGGARVPARLGDMAVRERGTSQR